MARIYYKDLPRTASLARLALVGSTRNFVLPKQLIQIKICLHTEYCGSGTQTINPSQNLQFGVFNCSQYCLMSACHCIIIKMINFFQEYIFINYPNKIWFINLIHCNLMGLRLSFLLLLTLLSNSLKQNKQ